MTNNRQDSCMAQATIIAAVIMAVGGIVASGLAAWIGFEYGERRGQQQARATATAQQEANLPFEALYPTSTPTNHFVRPTSIPEPFISAPTTRSLPSPAPEIKEIARFAVDSTVKKNRTNIVVKTGDVVEFEYLDGQWTGEQGKAPFNIGCGIQYRDNEPSHTWPLSPNGSGAALIGYVGNQPFFIGCERKTVTLADSGDLYLGINDCQECLWDNEGEIYVKIFKQSP